MNRQQGKTYDDVTACKCDASIHSVNFFFNYSIPYLYHLHLKSKKLVYEKI